MNNPDRYGRIRVAIVGNSGCGKTSLAILLATGKSLATPSLTVGGNIFVKLFREAEENCSAEQESSQAYFVELWDIGGQERYKPLWPLFLSNLNGVIIVYDGATSRGGASVQQWAEYVRQHATFMASLADEQAAANLAGLPVPFLVVANKADLKGLRASPTRLGAILRDYVGSLWQRLWMREEFGKLARSLSRAKSLAEHWDAKTEAIEMSTLRGKVDGWRFDAFFAECVGRRFHSGAPLQGLRQGSALAGASLKDGAELSPSGSSSSYRGPRRQMADGHERGDWTEHARIDEEL